MKRYKAVMGEDAIYLSRSDQIEKYRDLGCDIYEVDESGKETCIIASGKMLLSAVNDIEVEKRITGGWRSGAEDGTEK